MNMAISRNTNGWGTKEREETMTMPRFWGTKLENRIVLSHSPGSEL